MNNLAFEVLEARAEAHAVVPTIMLRARVTETGGRTVHALVLRGQIRIEPQRRRYQAGEEERLYDLFGETARWGESLRPFLWTHVATTLPAFSGSAEFDLPVECTYDLEVAATKYLHALQGGEIPLLLLFSGTVFTPRRSGSSGGTYFLGLRGDGPSPGVGVAGGHGPLLSQQRLAAPPP